MKKLLLFSLISLSFYFPKAQVVFCPPGAEWRYLFGHFGLSGIEHRNAIIYYTGYSVSGPDTIKNLKYSRFYRRTKGDACSNVSIKQRGDTIFMQNCNTKGTWQILYNFAATAGQQWTTSLIDSSHLGNHTPVTHTVIVNAVSTVTINGMNLKRLSVSYCSISPAFGTYHCETAEIIERIGCTTYLFNYENEMLTGEPDVLSDFLCYKDSTLGVKEYSQRGCNYVVAVGITENTLRHDKIKLYPMPANDLLSIEFSDDNFKNYEIKIVDALGQLVLEPESSIINSKAEIDVSVLKGGVYFLQLFDAGKLYGVQKIIKE